MNELNPYGGLWSGIASGVGSISGGIVALSGGTEAAQNVAIAQAQAQAEKAKADAAANALKYKYYAIGGTIILIIAIFFLVKIFKNKNDE